MFYIRFWALCFANQQQNKSIYDSFVFKLLSQNPLKSQIFYKPWKKCVALFCDNKKFIYIAMEETRQKRATKFLTEDQAQCVAKRCLTPHQSRGVNCFCCSINVATTNPRCCWWKSAWFNQIGLCKFSSSVKLFVVNSPVIVKIPTNKPIERPASITSSSESLPASFFRPAQIPTPKISK